MMPIAEQDQSPILLIESRQDLIDEILHAICSDLQITETQYRRAVDRYETIGDLLQSDERISCYNPDIFPQGSLALGTTLRPRDRREYDLDLVCTVDRDVATIARPSRLLDDILEILSDHGTYNPMLERRRFSRCVRISYKDDFHLDIVPACPDHEQDDGAILVPDRDAEQWCPGNPKRFASWFSARKELRFMEAMRKAVAPVPDYEPAERQPVLIRVVQLLKRWRDVAWQDEIRRPPSSIVLTTLAGESYGGEQSVYGALLKIVLGILSASPADGSIPSVPNPVQPVENLAESWRTCPQDYQTFIIKLECLYSRLRDLGTLSIAGGLSEGISTIFETVVPSRVLEAQARGMNTLKRRGNLAVSRVDGRLMVAGPEIATTIRRNTHFGYGRRK